MPQTPRFEVHKVLRLSRNLHIEAHKVLCLPRNLHFKVHKVLCLLRGLHVEVHKVLHLPRNLHVEVHKVLRLSRNLHFEVDKVLCLPRNLQTSHMPKSCDSVHLSQVQSSSKITTMSKVLRLPRNLHVKVKPLRSLAPVMKSRLSTTKTRGLAPAAKSDHHVRKCARHHNESAVARSTRPCRFREPAQSKCTSRISRGMNVL